MTAWLFHYRCRSLDRSRAAHCDGHGDRCRDLLGWHNLRGDSGLGQRALDMQLGVAALDQDLGNIGIFDQCHKIAHFIGQKGVAALLIRHVVAPRLLQKGQDG
jgi:hypothetical protein